MEEIKTPRVSQGLGIAGFVLSVGMAVDANILIFERTKEELRWGKSLGGAIPGNILLAPIVLNERVVNIACFDNGDKKTVTDDIAEVLILARAVSEAYHGIIKKRINESLKRAKELSGDEDRRRP